MISPDGDENIKLAEKILEATIMNEDERYSYYLRVKSFIESSKSCYVQGKKIINFLFPKEEDTRNDDE